MGAITTKGVELATLTLAMEELDELIPKGSFGKRAHKKDKVYGGKENYRDFKKGDRFKDIAIKQSIKTALRRGHQELDFGDLKAFERESRGRVTLIYALDASGSMKGNKIKLAKKAGIALAYHATQSKDKVGLIVFGSQIRNKVYPTLDFSSIIKELSTIRPTKETDLALTVATAMEMFTDKDCTNHLVLLTDGMHTTSDISNVLEQVMMATDRNISVSIIGIGLDSEGEKLAQDIVNLSKGKFYRAGGDDNYDQIILEDYYRYS